jgi:hypothetical protein
VPILFLSLSPASVLYGRQFYSTLSKMVPSGREEVFSETQRLLVLLLPGSLAIYSLYGSNHLLPTQRAAR